MALGEFAAIIVTGLLTPVTAVPAAPVGSTAALPAPASVAEVTDQTRVEFIADRLAEDPVYISDHVAGVVPPDRADDLRRIMEGAGVPFRLAVVLEHIEGAPRGERLAVALHDMVGADGLYVIADAQGIYVDAVGFGVNLPIHDALLASQRETPSDRGLERRLEVFVEVLTSDDAAARAERARVSEPPPTRSELRERREGRTVAISAVAGGVVVFGGLTTWTTVRRRRRRLSRRRRET